MNKKITIVDYGLGNVLSAQQSFKKAAKDKNIKVDVIISKLPSDIDTSTHVILPGQGAFKSCIDGLKNITGMIKSLERFALEDKKPFLGICIGMQLLATESYENGLHQGLNWIPGQIKKLPNKNLKMPHMGWNEVVLLKKNKNNLFIKESDYYFVHSFYFDCRNQDNIVAETNYGLNFASIVFKENIYGVQFHPEKSSKQGQILIESFIGL